jgi:hypothetical protein
MNLGYIGIQLYDFELQHFQTILLIGFLRQHKSLSHARMAYAPNLQSTMALMKKA